MKSPDTGGIVAGGRKIRVAVVFGGKGPEHAISCLGGGNVLRVIDRDKYEVIPIGITRDGVWLQVTDDPAKLAIAAGELPTVEAVAKPDAHVVPWAYQGDMEVVASAPGHIPHVFGDVDLVLPVLHGPFGEDGTIQGLLEMAGVPWPASSIPRCSSRRPSTRARSRSPCLRASTAARQTPACPVSCAWRRGVLRLRDQVP